MTDRTRVHLCNEHRPGTIGCYTRCRCSCLPCCDRWAAYMQGLRNGQTISTDAAEVAAQVERLHAAGWTYNAIAAEADVHIATLHNLRTGRSQRVGPRVAGAVADLHASLDERPLTLEAAPLVDAIQARLHGRLRSTMTTADIKAYHRAARTGRISEKLADRLAVRYLAVPPELVYGCDLSEVAA